MKGTRLSSIQNQISLNRTVRPNVDIAKPHCLKKLQPVKLPNDRSLNYRLCVM